MSNDHSYFKLKQTINNPIRIFFLCGSFFNHRDKTKIDKRIVLKEYIESLNPNYKCLILEENFLFRRDKSKLNYNDIDMKSLKDIEILTSLMSDEVIIFHESLSTAAEIGLFSSDTMINDKMTILAPDIYSTEEDMISGFIKYSYNNEFFEEYNIKIIRYYPGTYSYEISNNINKIHTYFVDNIIGENLKLKLSDVLENKKTLINIIKENNYNSTIDNISKFKVYKNKDKDNILEIKLNVNEFVTLLISLFTVDEVKRNLRKNANPLKGNSDIKITVLRNAIRILKEYFTKYIERSVLSTHPTLRYDKVKIKINYKDSSFNKAISYFVYVMYGINLIGINQSNRKLTIASQLDKILEEYADLIVSPIKGGIAEVLNIE